MKRVKSDWLYFLLLAIASAGIFWYYAQNVSGVTELRELPDTFGYLANAAYFSGTDWANATNLFYGYGYSLWLIPLFWLCDMGAAIIHRALLINVAFIVCIFWALVWILHHFFPDVSKYIHLVIAGALCLYPYLMKSSLTVWCESLLSLVVLLSAIFAYQALETQKIRYFIILGILLPYCFFVHARSVVFLAIFVTMFLVALWKNQTPWRNVCGFIIVGVVVFLYGYYIKQQLIVNVYNSQLQEYLLNNSSTEQGVGNLLRIPEMVGKIVESITTEFPEFIFSLFCKIFYLFVGTAGLFWVGVAYGFRILWRSIKSKSKISGKTFVMASFAVSTIVMLVAVSINLIGYRDDANYYFYGRYSEFLVFLPSAIGAAHLVEKKGKIRESLGTLILFLISLIFVYNLGMVVHTGTIRYDANGVPALSYGLLEIGDYRSMVTFYFGEAIFCFCIVMAINQNKFARYLIPLALFVNPNINNQVIADNIIASDQLISYENDVAEYIYVNNPDSPIYYLNSEGTCYPTVYTGLQGVLGTKKLNIIADRDANLIEKGAIVIAPWGNVLEEKRSDVVLLMLSDRYFIYYVVK